MLQMFALSMRNRFTRVEAYTYIVYLFINCYISSSSAEFLLKYYRAESTRGRND